MEKTSFLILFILHVTVLVACATVDKQRTVYSSSVEPDNAIEIQKAVPVPVLRVASLNLAHGRKDSFNQVFVGESAFKDNLDDVADVLRKYRPHVVALQEADAVSRWSGSFDHVAYLASAARYPWRTHVSNAEGWLYSYGTALLSELPFSESIQHTFEPSPPTLGKGFVLVQIEWPYGDGSNSRIVDVVSVHLDFSRQSVRENQIDEMIAILSERLNPTIIMGDFNSQWLAQASVIKYMAEKTRYRTYEPESAGYNTYQESRLDWILITKELEFTGYQVLPDNLSDHAMIIAEIRYKDE